MDWKFKVRGYAGRTHTFVKRGELLGESLYGSLAAAAVEIGVWQSRMLRGEVERAELIDLRPGGTLTDMSIHENTVIDWEKQT